MADKPVTLNPDAPETAADAVAPVDPREQMVTLSKDDLDALLNRAVAAGQAQSALIPFGSAAVAPEVPVKYTIAEALHMIAARLHFPSESDVHAIHAAIDDHFPAEVENDAAK